MFFEDPEFIEIRRKMRLSALDNVYLKAQMVRMFYEDLIALHVEIGKRFREELVKRPGGEEAAEQIMIDHQVKLMDPDFRMHGSLEGTLSTEEFVKRIPERFRRGR